MNDSSRRDHWFCRWRLSVLSRGAAGAFMRLLGLMLLLPFGLAQAQGSAAASPSVAFFYGANPPLDELAAFDIAVVEPDHVPDPKPWRREASKGASELFAYVSFGEVEPTRAFFKAVPPGVLKGQNEAWGSSVVDQTAPAWREFFIERIVAPLWERGYRGFFLDTLDSYHLIAKTPEARAVQEVAMVATLNALRARFPGIRLIFNRGFEILPQVSNMVTAVAAESVYRGWDQANKRYREVPAADREWLLGQLGTVRDKHRLPVIAIDYVAPGERDLARDTARRILALGFTPWVANPDLDMLGVGRVEVVPRRVLVLTDMPAEQADFHNADAHRFLGMPLNHLGYAYDLLDPRSETLPEGTLRGRYAGVVTWLGGTNSQVDAKVAAFIKRHIGDGVRVAVFNQFPFPLDAAMNRELGLATVAGPAGPRLAIVRRDPMFGFEFQPLPNRRELVAIKADAASRPLLRLEDQAGKAYDAAAITTWGGFVLSPFALVSMNAVGQQRWVVNPLSFLRAALAPEPLPVPDVTTESGRRILFAHVDGDGWASRAEFPGSPYASEVMAREILERYRIPTTVSVIQGEIALDGLYKAQSPALEAIARRIYALPGVEVASHSYSHPFVWASAGDPRAAGEAPMHLDIPGYRFALSREIAGSIDYINRTLLPSGKRTAVFLWTGDCMPTPEAIRETYAAGVLNMNGGDTLITKSAPTWSLIASQGIRKRGFYQVYAPNQNENVYTNNWTGPFYGFERVIETFELTETPHRFKPINIYYHTYAASKPASLNALKKVYQYALAQPVTPIYASEYIRKVLDFERMVIARATDSGEVIVRGDGSLRTLRADPGVAIPNLVNSRGIIGVTEGGAARYITLDGAETRLAVGNNDPAPPRLADANGRVTASERSGNSFGFTLESHVAPVFRLAGTERCSVTINGKPARAAATVPAASGPSLQRYESDPASLGRAPHQQVVRVRCVQ